MTRNILISKRINSCEFGNSLTNFASCIVKEIKKNFNNNTIESINPLYRELLIWLNFTTMRKNLADGVLKLHPVNYIK